MNLKTSKYHIIFDQAIDKRLKLERDLNEDSHTN
jgi:hypothetical protein